MSEAIISARKITKRFLGTVALDQIDFDVMPNEIHAIVGENGAGKSTICKILTGLYRPDEGELYMDGKPIQFHNTHESITAGIGMLYQERNLVKFLDCAQNMALGNEPGKFGIISDKRIHQIAQELSAGSNIKCNRVRNPVALFFTFTLHMKGSDSDGNKAGTQEDCQLQGH